MEKDRPNNEIIESSFDQIKSQKRADEILGKMAPDLKLAWEMTLDYHGSLIARMDDQPLRSPSPTEIALREYNLPKNRISRKVHTLFQRKH